MTIHCPLLNVPPTITFDSLAFLSTSMPTNPPAAFRDHREQFSDILRAVCGATVACVWMNRDQREQCTMAITAMVECANEDDALAAGCKVPRM